MLKFKSNVPHIDNELLDVVRSFTNACNINFCYDESYGVKIDIEGKSFAFDILNCINDCKHENRKLFVRQCKIALYKAMREYFSCDLPWGSLTGIRPTKLVYEILKAGDTLEAVAKKLQADYFVSKPKAQLAAQIAANQLKTVGPVNDSPPANIKSQKLSCGKQDGRSLTDPTTNRQTKVLTHNPCFLSSAHCSLYIHIPFCPTCCDYCSFVSVPVSKQKKLVAPYVEKLIAEINEAKKLISQQKQKIHSIYIGGGTPTVLDNTLLEQVLKAVGADSKTEFTLEAGRPETLTQENLELMKQYGVTRVSVNPQSLNNKTLQKIGRGHTAEDFYNGFNLVKKFGFIINVDLIAGLEGESLDDFLFTLNGIVFLEPHNITVHTLSVKRGSSLSGRSMTAPTGGIVGAVIDCPQIVTVMMGAEQQAGTGSLFLEQQQKINDGCIHKKRSLSPFAAKSNSASDMMDAAQTILTQNGYLPYYLYRQKNMRDNLENVGYTKKDFACINNIIVMEEFLSVVACGAGAISKRIFHHQNRIERLANPKDVKMYIERLGDIIAKQRKFFSN